MEAPHRALRRQGEKSNPARSSLRIAACIVAAKGALPIDRNGVL
jgi:hypothetical protein